MQNGDRIRCADTTPAQQLCEQRLSRRTDMCALSRALGVVHPLPELSCGCTRCPRARFRLRAFGLPAPKLAPESLHPFPCRRAPSAAAGLEAQLAHSTHLPHPRGGTDLCPNRIACDSCTQSLAKAGQGQAAGSPNECDSLQGNWIRCAWLCRHCNWCQGSGRAAGAVGPAWHQINSEAARMLWGSRARLWLARAPAWPPPGRRSSQRRVPYARWGA